MHIEFRRWTIAWLALCVALALHVAEEWSSGMFEIYDLTVELLRDSFPLLPIPPFHYAEWLRNIIGSTIVLFALTWGVHKRFTLMRPGSYAFALFMLGNALLHLFASLNAGHMLPGAWSAILIVFASFFLLVSIPVQSGNVEPQR